jgi:hypothetical protein
MSTGEILRDRGAAQALSHEEWRFNAMRACALFFKRTASGALIEDARLAVEPDVGEPASPNAWGAIALCLSRRGVIAKTGVWRKSSDPRSHARMQPEWRWVR